MPRKDVYTPRMEKGGDTKPAYELRVPQIRVMRVLARSGGPLTRAEISKRIGNKTNVVVGRAVGYSDPDKRAAFRQTKDGKIAGTPLLDLGFIQEVRMDIDGVMEIGIELTDTGRAAYKALGRVQLGGLKDGWAMSRESEAAEETETEGDDSSLTLTGDDHEGDHREG